jgi:two-component system sensor histidine kinase/response regulator
MMKPWALPLPSLGFRRHLRMLLSLLLPFLALVLQLRLGAQIEPSIWLFFYPAVFISGWLGGLVGGVLATLLSLVLVKWFFMAPGQTLTLTGLAQGLPLAIFATLGLFMSLIQQRLHAQVGAEDRLRCITDTAHDAIIMMNPRGEITYWNPAATTILGYSAEEALGQNLHRLLAPEVHLRQHHAAFPEFRRSGQGAAIGKTLELPAKGKNGQEITVELSLSAVALKDGWNAIGILRDITEPVKARLQITEAMNRLTLATEAADIGIWNWDIPTGKLEWDPRLLAWYQVPEEIRDQGLDYDFWRSRLHPDDREGAEAKLQKAIRDQVTNDDVFRIVLPGGRVRYIHSVSVIERQDAEGRPLRVLGVNRDITAQRELEEELRAAKEAAEAANAAKSRFLAHMSHEIRTPMNAVLGMTQILARSALTPDQGAMVEQIHTAGRSLLLIINDILDLSRIEAGQIPIEERPFGLAPILAQIEHLLGATARDKGLTLRIPPITAPAGDLLGDPLRLEQILVNLIGNAIKFTVQGEIQVRVTPLEIGATTLRLRFEVSDPGIGITPEALTGIFSPFTQADSSITRRFGGTGLGLSISKRLVELLGGRIGVDSQVGAGSTFWFELPFKRAPRPPADPGPVQRLGV